jgi:hypothetical protein
MNGLEIVRNYGIFEKDHEAKVRNSITVFNGDKEVFRTRNARMPVSSATPMIMDKFVIRNLSPLSFQEKIMEQSSIIRFRIIRESQRR